MRRRILVAIITVTALSTAALTVPLSLIIARRERAAAVLELDRVAQRSLVGVSGRTGTGGNDEPIELPRAEPDTEVGVYLPDGRKIAGDGPGRADPVTASVDRVVESGLVGDDLVLANPVIVNEETEAIIRVSEPAAESASRTRRDVLLLILFDLAAIGLAAAVGWFVAARLAKPVRTIRDDAVRLGDGDFSIVAHHSGVTELDNTADALASTASRLGDLLARERAFSADASHELRTPLAALRLSIETELLDHRDDPDVVLQEALVQIERLSTTITTLLDVARDGPVDRAPLDVDRAFADLDNRWAPAFAASGRHVRCIAERPVTAHVSRAVLEQILGILLSNSLDHGAGTVTVRIEMSGEGLSITVGDEGHLDRDPHELFSRRDPGASGHGVGLSLARSLAEAEGGRLVLSNDAPTSFLLVLPNAHRSTTTG